MMVNSEIFGWGWGRRLEAKRTFLEPVEGVIRTPLHVNAR